MVVVAVVVVSIVLLVTYIGGYFGATTSIYDDGGIGSHDKFIQTSLDVFCWLRAHNKHHNPATYNERF